MVLINAFIYLNNQFVFLIAVASRINTCPFKFATIANN